MEGKKKQSVTGERKATKLMFVTMLCREKRTTLARKSQSRHALAQLPAL